jgi:predicted ester cyclase
MRAKPPCPEEELMRGFRTLYLVAFVFVLGGGLTLNSAAQKKPYLAPEPKINPREQPEQKKVPVRQLYEEMFTHGRYELLEQAFEKNCPVHFGNRTIRLQEAVMEGKGWRSAAPDLVMAIEKIDVKGDMVEVVWEARGTHTGQGHGLKPTGRRVAMRSTSRFRVVNGKIVEAWNEEYRPELFRQIGVSKTQAFMFFAGEKLWTTIGAFIPDSFYSSLP